MGTVVLLADMHTLWAHHVLTCLHCWQVNSEIALTTHV